MIPRQLGFALVDVSIATLIAGAVLGGVVGLSSVRMNAGQEHAAQLTISEARRALVAHAQVHRRLPCPADPRLPSTHPRAGQEGARRGGACEFGNFGALPWTTLGLSELDAWGSRLTYRVAADFADGADQCGAKPPSDAADCLRLAHSSSSHTATTNSLVVKEDRGSGGASPEVIAHGLAAVVVSHGANGRFAYLNSGLQRAGAGRGRYEASNADPRSVTFYTAPVDRRLADCQSVTNGADCAHDDVLGWISRAEITTSMVRAGHQ